MEKSHSSMLLRVLTFVATLLIVKVTLSIVLEYRNYFPPNFESDFLRGRTAYFWGGYHYAFYAHLISGPVSIILGTILVSDRFRKNAQTWHRRLGRIHAAFVLLLVAPSGLWMAYYSETGSIAAVGLGSLAITTAACLVLGWRAAVAQRIADHNRWMWRCFILLCSAVVIRMIGGLATVAQVDGPWLYPVSTWASWILPLAIFEFIHSLDLRDQHLDRAAT